MTTSDIDLVRELRGWVDVSPVEGDIGDMQAAMRDAAARLEELTKQSDLVVQYWQEDEGWVDTHWLTVAEPRRLFPDGQYRTIRRSISQDEVIEDGG